MGDGGGIVGEGFENVENSAKRKDTDHGEGWREQSGIQARKGLQAEY